MTASTEGEFSSDLKELQKEIASLGRSKLEQLLIQAIRRYQAAEAPKPPEHTCKGLNAVFYTEPCPGCIAQNKGKAVMARSCVTPGCSNPALIVRYSCISCHEAKTSATEDTGGHIGALPGFDPFTRSVAIQPAKRCREMLGIIQCALDAGHEGRHSLPALTWTSPNDPLSKMADTPDSVSTESKAKHCRTLPVCTGTDENCGCCCLECNGSVLTKPDSSTEDNRIDTLEALRDIASMIQYLGDQIGELARKA